MKQQLTDLLHASALVETPWPWLIQFPRYMATIRLRLQRLGSGGLKTEQNLERDFTPWQQKFEQLDAELQKQQRQNPMLDHYRWLLEEFRVSLFAQKLGTAVPVSTRKLQEQWDRVIGMM